MKTIILIGFMGAGKTSIGRRFSGKHNIDFIDTDHFIEEKVGMKISDIFNTHGEDCFRKLETKVLSELLEIKENKVISVGGGLPMRKENREILKQLGVIVYLEVSKESILERTGQDTSRPLLRGEDKEEKISMLLEERDPVYKKLADFTVVTDKKSFYEIMDEIEVRLDENSYN